MPRNVFILTQTSGFIIIFCEYRLQNGEYFVHFRRNVQFPLQLLHGKFTWFGDI